jgi:hypothetical protein
VTATASGGTAMTAMEAAVYSGARTVRVDRRPVPPPGPGEVQLADAALVEPDRHRRAVAQALGLAVLDPGTDDVRDAVEGWTSGAGADVAFEVSGAQAGVDAASRRWRRARA